MVGFHTIQLIRLATLAASCIVHITITLLINSTSNNFRINIEPNIMYESTFYCSKCKLSWIVVHLKRLVKRDSCNFCERGYNARYVVSIFLHHFFHAYSYCFIGFHFYYFYCSRITMTNENRNRD